VTASPTKRSFGLKDLHEFGHSLAALRTELEPPTSPGGYVAHTDGACLGNPEGPGGWAAVVETADVPAPWLLFGHLSSTSNNRAEALGILAALEWIPSGSRLALFSDSELSVRILQGRYKAKANPDIWSVIFRVKDEKRLMVAPEWVRGHAGDRGNELADRLSKLGALNGAIDSIDQLVTEAPTLEVPPDLVGLEPRGEWEREFIRSVADQLRRNRPLSPKQQAIVEKIRARGLAS
jgi:ribonuclease HI